MASTSETGHAKNVANFASLISFADGYGSDYNPTKNIIKLANLQTLHTDSDKAVKKVNNLVPAFTDAVNARQAAFNPLNKLCTRIINALDSSEVDNAIVKDARTLINKISGKRKSEKPEPTAGEDSKAHSASQMSYDLRQDNFNKLVELLKSQPNYAPNETDLQNVSLDSVYTNLEKSNDKVKTAYTPLSNARIARDKTLYEPDKGLVDVAGEAKKYIKSVYGGTSPQYKQVSGLKFTVIKSK